MSDADRIILEKYGAVIEVRYQVRSQVGGCVIASSTSEQEAIAKAAKLIRKNEAQAVMIHLLAATTTERAE